MSDMTYLHVRGTLQENMVYSPLPGYESSRRGRAMEGDLSFHLILLDSEDRPLLTVSPEVRPSGCSTTKDPVTFQIRGKIPLHPEGTVYELRKDLAVLYREDIPKAPPKVTGPVYRRTSSTISLKWPAGEAYPARTAAAASRPRSSSRKLTYSISALMASGRRITLASGLEQCAHPIKIATMPVSGKAKIFLGVHDGVRSSEIEVGAVEVPFRPPTAHILSPAPNSQLPFGHPVSVLGCCIAMDGQPCPPENISWSIDDEVFATGSTVVALDKAPPGDHRLTLSYKDTKNKVHVKISTAIAIQKPTAEYFLWEKLTG
jgi:hypothetical protein